MCLSVNYIILIKVSILNLFPPVTLASKIWTNLYPISCVNWWTISHTKMRKSANEWLKTKFYTSFWHVLLMQVEKIRMPIQNTLLYMLRISRCSLSPHFTSHSESGDATLLLTSLTVFFMCTFRKTSLALNVKIRENPVAPKGLTFSVPRATFGPLFSYYVQCHWATFGPLVYFHCAYRFHYDVTSLTVLPP